MFKWYHIFGFIWTLPVSILGWLALSILAILHQIEDLSVYPDFTCIWDVRNNGWLYKAFKEKWFGFTVGNNIVIIDQDDSEVTRRCLLHERRHAMQQYCWGILFFPVYILESLRIFIFCKDEHSYLDNFFEIDARKYAGQMVEIPRHLWPDGEKDRWPWW